MFTYFSKNKLRYNKGQLAPFFIVILAVIIIMALVTANLSKVALTRTETSNAVDAGSIAAGSIMATVFNSVAKQNAQMEFSFWSSFTAISVSFTIAISALAFALGFGCVEPCASLTAANIAWWTTLAIGISVLALKLIQYYTLQIIKDKIAKKGWEGAVKAGHQFVFFNSGIGQKLKEGPQRDDFRNFMNTVVGSVPTYTYSWQDGQGRAHNVTSTVTIDKVNKFKMQTTLLPSLAITAFLIAAGLLAGKASFILTESCIGCPAKCSGMGPAFPACLAACRAGWCAVLSLPIIGAIVALAAAWAGISPTGPITEDDEEGSILGAIGSMWIYAWIDDIDHNRLVRVESIQRHAGADLGLWKTQYPDTTSYSVSNFRGRGKIHPPVLRHGCDIIETDKIGGGL